MDVTWHNIIFVYVFLCFLPFPSTSAIFIFVIGIWRARAWKKRVSVCACKTLQREASRLYHNDRHWHLFYTHRTVWANNVIWYREISLFHTLPFLSNWKIYKFHLFTDVVDDWGWKHFTKRKRYTQMPWMIKQKYGGGKEELGRSRWIRWCNNRFMRFVDMIFLFFLVGGLIYSTSFTGILVVPFFSLLFPFLFPVRWLLQMKWS